MKKILFTIALPQELRIIKEEIKNIKSFFKVDFLLTGVGNYNVIYNLKDYIEKKEKPDFIVNIGVCGDKSEDYKDFFQVYKIKNFQNNKESICPIYINFLDLKGIYSSEKVITNSKELIEEDFVDMESFGIDFIGTRENIPYIIIKKPFDVVGENSKNVNINDLITSLKNFDYEKLFLKIEDFFNQDKENDFENEINILKKKYRLTFSETIILKKFINKKISFGENFLDIFNNLNILEKKEFLISIKN